MTHSTLIIGAGLTGLSCAYALTEALVLEGDSAVGGVAKTNNRSGFLFDCTGHWLHLRDPDIKQLVDSLIGDELLTIPRRAAIYSHGMLTDYPFQAHTHGLPLNVIADCVLGYFRAREAAARGDQPEPTFEAFIRHRLGDGIADHFMIPYNSKIWTVHPREMSHVWCERFVPIPSPEDVVYGALSPTGAGHALGYNAVFRYPQQGGMGRLAEALHDRLKPRVRCNAQVEAVDWRQKIVTLNNGESLTYRTLVSTMPLNKLLASMRDLPEIVQSAAAALRYSSVTYWDTGFAGDNSPNDKHWVYFPEADFPFYRAGSASAALPSLAPPGHRSYYVEVAHPGQTPCHVTDTQILAGMRRAKMIGEHDEPIVMKKTTIDCAYVTMDHNYGEARRTILEWLLSQQIESVGRYGAWTYDSMEGALASGRSVGMRLRSANA